MFIDSDAQDHPEPRHRHLRAIGYWKEPEHPAWPDPHDFVDASWDPSERDTVIAYLGAGDIVHQEPGYSWCRFNCGVGAPKKFVDITDEDIAGAFQDSGAVEQYDELALIALAQEYFAESLAEVMRKEHMGTHCVSDGTYIWPEGFVHYLKEHAVRPPDEFVQHVLQETAQGGIL